MRSALLSSTIAILLAVCQAAEANSQLDSATLKQLTMLEQKFFGHTYANETDDERTERIEKLILGSASEGPATSRIKKLASITYLDTRPDPVEAPAAQSNPPVAAPPAAAASHPASPAVPAPVASHPVSPAAPAPVASHPVSPAAPTPTVSHPVTAAPTPVASHPSSPAVPSRSVQRQPVDDDSSDVPPSKPGADDYPHVTSLEKDILGATYVGQPLTARIVRMETKAFGAPSKSADLGERTDNLELFAEQKLHKKPFLSDEMTDATIEETPSPERSQSDGGSTSLQSDYPHITALENAILGQASPSLPLEKRISNLEVKAFGTVSKSDDLSSRTDALERYAEKTLHKKPYGSDLAYDAADGSGTGKTSDKKGMKLLNMVGNSLLGMGMNTMGGGMGMMPGMGMGMPGMGMMGPGGSGFGGIRVRRRQAPAEDASAADEPTGPVEDPMVRAKDPPPASARLATRVGWCEMHVFGKTSPNLHLAERLTLLNRELKFEPGKGAMELMDHIDGLVKSAQAYKAPAIGAQPGATVN
ncbi:MAG TPA: hypothetical protein V6C89_13905 [Drouetiella sp.]